MGKKNTALKPSGPGASRRVALIPTNTPNTATSRASIRRVSRLATITTRHSPNSKIKIRGASLAWAIPVLAIDSWLALGLKKG